MDNISSIRETMYTTRGEEPYELVLQRAQSQIASSLKKNIEAISESELKEIIEKHITAHGVKCNLTGSVTELTNYIYHDMAGLSFITRDKLFNREGFEEIDINAWNDVEIVINGKRTKTDYSFLSPQHAIDIHERMFRKTSTMFNDAKPRATADIGEGIRITAQKAPIVDADVAGASSIRKVNMNVISRDALIDGKAITPPMFDFLLLCVKHGVSICLSGETGTGKTTLAGCLLSMAAQVLRIYTIEEGSREWNFVLKDEHGKPLNSVIHTRTRPNVDNPSLNIDQEDLVMDSLRFDPDIIAPGEIRGREAFEIMGVSNTGHTVVTTIHSNGTEDTPTRIVSLAKKAFDMSDHTLYEMAARAFPILVHCEKNSDNKRRITEIREVTGYENGKIQSRMLFEYVVYDNIYDGDVCTETIGKFVQHSPISENLTKKLLKKGARRSEVEPYLTCEGCS